jgi:3-hydroxy-9,10-secoandrosta-1,3,5(10)-triene-9,17-dione monooxygenase reductase component
VSLYPPAILVSIGHESEGLPLFRAAGAYAVNILSARQEVLARRFAQKPLPPHAFADVPHQRTAGGAIVFREALAWLEAEVVQEVEAFDHTLFVAQVREGHLGAPLAALSYHRSAYRAL